MAGHEATKRCGRCQSPALRPVLLSHHVDDPLRIAAARALAGWIAMQGVSRRSLRLVAWQPLAIQHSGLVAGRRLQATAAALVEIADERDVHVEQIIVVPDLATAPIASIRPTLLRLFESLADARACGDGCPVRLLVATTNVDGAGGRRLAWLRLVQRLGVDTGAAAVAVDVQDWPQLQGFLRLYLPTHGRADRRLGHRRRRADEMLDLIGRHPLLTIKQLADLLGVTPRRVLYLRNCLIQQGLVRLLGVSDLGPCAQGRRPGNRVPLADLAELTDAGRRQLARQLGMSVPAARRYHGLFGGTPRHRRRALRNLEHTVGANQVFVTLAVVARHARARGGDEALEEWRPAAACEHWRCKPDGYGAYRRGRERFGFLVEYDRGSERAAQYDAKLAAYHAYAGSEHAARRFTGLPHVLFVAETDAAEARIAAAIQRARARHGDQGFRFLTTTMVRLRSSGIP